jgi:membrane protein involved in colicin uptake
MAKQDKLYNEEEHKRRGIIISLILHSLLFLFLLLPFLTKPEIQQSEGILIAFGDPFAGSDDAPEITEEETQAATSSAAAAPTSAKDEAISSLDQVDEAPVKAVEKKSTKPSDADKNKAKEVSDAKIKADAKAKADAAAKAEADRKAAEKAKAEKEAADKAAAAANQKKKYSDLLGKGKGNNSSTGNQGQNNGDPDGKALEGISKGTGKVGGGLSGRGIEYSPSFTDNSQKTGKVSLSICVNPDGKVTKAEFTQKGSTTSDSYLIDLARKTALKYKFSKSEIDSQCGTVTIDFRVQ